ncbi:MAG: 3-dehydro-L-gulonate 2-dehydrogenase [Granulicella sp.]
MLRVPYQELESALIEALLPFGFTAERATLCARLIAETTRDGVYTHGLSRFPRFLEMIRNGSVDPGAESSLVTAFGGLERWDGNAGVGNLNAWASMQRAMKLAREHGIGAIALANTNHWMRGGTYGWQAADEGLFALCFTNTLPNLPAWGTTTPSLGNNPLVVAIPRPAGNIVLDMAMSQFSYGTLSAYAKSGSQLPVPGGYDATGALTTDPAAIEASHRALPIGFWKGSGLSMTLDLIAAMLSGGKASYELGQDPLRETGLSQVFLAIDSSRIGDPASLNAIAEGILTNLKNATPAIPGRPARYPGEQTLTLRRENMAKGVPVDREIWEKLTADNAAAAGKHV